MAKMNGGYADEVLRPASLCINFVCLCRLFINYFRLSPLCFALGQGLDIFGLGVLQVFMVA